MKVADGRTGPYALLFLAHMQAPEVRGGVALGVEWSPMGGSSWAVWAVLAAYCGGRPDGWGVTVATLQADTGCSRSTVFRALADLQSRGLLQATPERKANGGQGATRFHLSARPSLSHAQDPPRVTGDTPQRLLVQRLEQPPLPPRSGGAVRAGAAANDAAADLAVLVGRLEPDLVRAAAHRLDINSPLVTAAVAELTPRWGGRRRTAYHALRVALQLRAQELQDAPPPALAAAPDDSDRLDAMARRAGFDSYAAALARLGGGQ